MNENRLNEEGSSPPEDADTKPSQESGFSRREFLRGASLTVAAGVAGGAPALVSAQEKAAKKGTIATVGPGPVKLTLSVNGEDRAVEVEPWVTLLDTLRDRIDLTGTKRVCDRGSCGACTVLVDGKIVNSCTMLAIDADGKQVQTIEGIADGEKLSTIQQAFVDCDALQCGFCTPGMVVAATALVERVGTPTLDQVKKGLAGNICRCGTYQNIFEAIQQACDQKGGAK